MRWVSNRYPKYMIEHLHPYEPRPPTPSPPPKTNKENVFTFAFSKESPGTSCTTKACCPPPGSNAFVTVVCAVAPSSSLCGLTQTKWEQNPRTKQSAFGFYRLGFAPGTRLPPTTRAGACVSILEDESCQNFPAKKTVAKGTLKGVPH